jgi:hypothetical protein
LALAKSLAEQERGTRRPPSRPVILGQAQRDPRPHLSHPPPSPAPPPFTGLRAGPHGRGGPAKPVEGAPLAPAPFRFRKTRETWAGTALVATERARAPARPFPSVRPTPSTSLLPHGEKVAEGRMRGLFPNTRTPIPNGATPPTSPLPAKAGTHPDGLPAPRTADRPQAAPRLSPGRERGGEIGAPHPLGPSFSGKRSATREPISPHPPTACPPPGLRGDGASRPIGPVDRFPREGHEAYGRMAGHSATRCPIRPTHRPLHLPSPPRGRRWPKAG